MRLISDHSEKSLIFEIGICVHFDHIDKSLFALLLQIFNAVTVKFNSHCHLEQNLPLSNTK